MPEVLLSEMQRKYIFIIPLITNLTVAPTTNKLPNPLVGLLLSLLYTLSWKGDPLSKTLNLAKA